MFLNDIAAKWQKKWDDVEAFKAVNDTSKKKMYCLDMYPYPSGSMHMGHIRNYSIGDALARFYRMQGYNVLYPIGFDAFGLPAENAAIKDGIHPEIHTINNMNTIREQFKLMGFSFDWSREIASLNPNYYKWNQWIFLKFLEKGLAYRKNASVNWCSSCTTVLANEQVEEGKCWRCATVVEQKSLAQWFFKITHYADQLLKDLDILEAWPEKVKTMQKNWIGRSEGVEINFPIEELSLNLPCFTTRADTIFSVTFLCIAPEHPLVEKLVAGTKQQEEVNNIIAQIKQQTEIERTTPEGKDKIGAFIGRYAVNPATQQQIPIYIANFVLVNYGTGIVMADAHDSRDFAFARKYNIPLKFVISADGKPLSATDATESYLDDGILFDSAQFSGIRNREALPNMMDWLVEQKYATKTINYKLRDWLISRQRYWGTPIPIIHCEECGAVPVPEQELPVLLPKDVTFSGKENPLTTSQSFVNTSCPTCNKPAKRETDTMDTFIDSSWYYLRFTDPHNEQLPFSKEAADYWMNVEQYTGGIEHAILHLLYARFITKALRDMGLHSIDEPFKQLLCQGMILKDGAKMSKSKNNIVPPSEVVNHYGQDTARMFALFASLPEKDFEWSDEGVAGIYRFLKRIYTFATETLFTEDNVAYTQQDHFLFSKLHMSIKQLTELLEQRRFNMAITLLMELFQYIQQHDTTSTALREVTLCFAQLIAPFSPHLAEEVWECAGGKGLVAQSSWPLADEEKIRPDAVALEELLTELRADIRSVIALSKLSNPKRITIYVSEQWKYSFFEELKEQLEYSHDFKTVLDTVMQKEHAESIIQYVKKAIKQNIFPSHVLSQEKEISSLQKRSELFVEFLQQYNPEFSNNSITVLVAEDAPEEHKQKAKRAEPGKPSFILA